MENLTDKQRFLLEFIESYQLEYGKSPTVKEMKEYCNVSSDNSILKVLNALEEKGYIEKDGTPRGIKLLTTVKARLQNSDEAGLIPLLGFVPAGVPTMNEEYIQDWVSVGKDVVSNTQDCFLLRVYGDSMVDAGILEGDLVVVDRKKTAKHNDIVVALVDNANTVKRLIKKNGNLYLKAENSAYSNIMPEEALEVQGVVVGLIRHYL